MRYRTALVTSVAVAMLVGTGTPAAAQDADAEVIASGLDNPSSITIAPDGSLWVPEAVPGGDLCPFEIPGLGPSCINASGAVTRIADGRQ